MPRLSVESLRTSVSGPWTLQLAAGECVVVTGPSGSGKSLLLRAICDLDPSTGAVALDARRREEFTPREWRRSVGLLPAEPAWWAETVGEHFPAGAEEVLKALGFDEDVLGWQVARASSGERQRLALARLLQLQPRVLLLDEPTANLDAGNRARVESVVRDYLASRAAAALWVTHDAEQAVRIGDRELVMQAGRLEDAACT
ncbi:ATP-binding protein [Acidihalobacter aeolianus]|uniref:ATP-binding protein n=1 Tax=Acidihalobacter aeolianus TaxID=2792603 RepID=A0A1D8K4Q1_9GAMM|nr:ATP-binding cassette domain-containing protein [Acidihalobacter aeolianus]AOV15932.1 ATP-binding protein [Acidihalobacter aeolianus]